MWPINIATRADVADRVCTDRQPGPVVPALPRRLALASRPRRRLRGGHERHRGGRPGAQRVEGPLPDVQRVSLRPSGRCPLSFTFCGLMIPDTLLSLFVKPRSQGQTLDSG